MSSIHAVIMAGGVGSRFWPMSRSHKPKQFLDFMGSGKTLIQMTFDRLTHVCAYENIWVVCHSDYIDLVKSQLPKIKTENILAEPSRKNTAPCIAYATAEILMRDPHAKMIVAPADHLITNEQQFTKDLEECIEFLNINDGLLTLGIQASRPDTGYGYIHFDQSKDKGFEIYPVLQFVEKPNHNTAVEYLKQGTYLWNSGMFIWKASNVMNEIKLHLPDLYSFFENYSSKTNISDIYSHCESVSIDVGIMEKSEKVFVKTVDFGWSDLGTFGSVYALSDHDKNANSINSHKKILNEVEACFIRNEENKLIAIQGLKNCIVINTKDVLMICDMQSEQQIKKLVHDVEHHYGNSLI